MTKMLGRLGWRGQCSCCNGPKDTKAIRAEEKVQFRLLTDEEVAQSKEGRWALEDAREDARQQAVRACDEHAWVLELDEPDEDYDDSIVSLSCTKCPADIDDIYVDGTEMIFLAHEGVSVSAGRHNMPTAMTIPVDVKLHESWSYWGEYDAELIITPKPTGWILTPEDREAAEAVAAAQIRAYYGVEGAPLPDGVVPMPPEPHTQ